MQMAGACVGAIFAALADPYLAGFAVNVIQPHSCGDVVSQTFGNVSECCQRFNCNITENEGTPVYDMSGDDSMYQSILNEIESPSGPYYTESLMWGPAFVVELIGTYMLCLVVLMTVVDKDSVVGNTAPLAIGLSVFFAHIIAIPITNCSINPARSFGAAVAASIFPWYNEIGSDMVLSPRITQAWEQQAFFWAVPICGGLLASLTYWGMFSQEYEKLKKLEPAESESAESGNKQESTNKGTEQTSVKQRKKS